MILGIRSWSRDWLVHIERVAVYYTRFGERCTYMQCGNGSMIMADCLYEHEVRLVEESAIGLCERADGVEHWSIRLSKLTVGTCMYDYLPT